MPNLNFLKSFAFGPYIESTRLSLRRRRRSDDGGTSSRRRLRVLAGPGEEAAPRRPLLPNRKPRPPKSGAAAPDAGGAVAVSSAAGNGGGATAPPPPPPATAAAAMPRSCVDRDQGPCLNPGPVGARDGGCLVALNIKHPCNPKPVCCCLAIQILQPGGAHNFMGKVYTRYIPGIEWRFI